MVPRRRDGRLSAVAAAFAGSRGSSRRRTSSASGRARSPCSRAAGSCARPRSRSPSCCRPRRRGPRRSSSSAGSEIGVEGLSEELALAGYERVERVDDRGQFAVRGGLIDVFPTTGREPLRIEFFGDEVESIRAFSPFTQRALHPVEACTIFPAAERRLDLVEEWHGEEGELRPVPADLVPPLDRAPDFVFQPDDVRRIWAEDGLTPVSLDGTTELDPVPAEPAVRVRGAAARDRRRAGSRRPRSSSPRSCAPGSASSSRSRIAARRCARRTCCAASRRSCSSPATRCPSDAGLFFAVAPARRGFVWRELGLVLLPDHQVFRRRVPRERRLGGRALQSFADLRTGDYVVHEDHGVGKLLGFETKEVAGVTRDYLLLAFRGDDRLYVPHEQLGKRLALRRRRRVGARALEARRQGVAAAQVARARVGAGARVRADRALRAAADARGHRVRPEQRVAAAARGVVPVPRDARPGERDRGGEGGSRGARARWTGSSAATSASARRRSPSAPRSRSR